MIYKHNMKKHQLKQLIKEEIHKVFLIENDEPPPGPEIPAETPSTPEGAIDKETAKELIKDTKGKIFTVTFIKKGGSVRVLNGRLGVTKHLKGGTLGYDPIEKGLIPVWDIKVKGYRVININTITNLKIGKKEYDIN